MRLTLTALLALTVFACRKPDDEDADGDIAGVDCDDSNPEVNSQAVETCNTIDDNCNGIVDADAVDLPTFFGDADGDGYGTAASPAQGCAAPAGFVTDNTDCDDTAADYYPGADEKDCTDPADYNCDGSSGFADDDADGFAACKECDDADASISPVATEVCDGLDNDCDGDKDAGAVNGSTWFADTDADGFGDAATSTLDCSQPTGHVADDNDCNDADDTVFPGATETCDRVDENCNDVIDEDASDMTTWYADVDKDGFAGANISTQACEAPPGYFGTSPDCDDLDAQINPTTIWYADVDDDGFGDPTKTVVQCTAPLGYIDNSDDCDDSDAALNPDTAWYVDGDADGFGSLSKLTQSCTQPSGYAASPDDCDDGDGARYPGNLEACDGFDNDCDAKVDEAGATGETVYYFDGDADGAGGNKTLSSCTAPGGAYLTVGNDCDDTDDTTYPSAKLGCDDLDHDCDGNVDNDFDNDDAADAWCGGSDCYDKDAAKNPSTGDDCSCVTPGNGTGTGPTCAAENCNDIKLAGKSTGDGFYWLHPEGGSKSAAYEGYCDMTRDGGGWTLVGDYQSNAELFAWDPTKHQLQGTGGGSTVTAPPKLDGSVKGHVAYNNFGSDGSELRLECRLTPTASWTTEITPLFADYNEGDVGVYGAARWGIVTRGVAYSRNSHWSCGSATGGAGTWRGLALCSGNGAGGSFANHRVSLNFNTTATSYGGGLSIGCNAAGFDLGKSNAGEAKVWHRRVPPKPLVKLDFEGNYTDTSGANRNGVPFGAMSLEPGYVGQAARFRGTGGTTVLSNSWVELPNMTQTTAISVSAWIKSNQVGRYLGVWQMVSNYSEFILGTGSTDSNDMCFIVYTVRGWEYGSCFPVPNPTEWHHFIGTYDSASGVKRMYVDGILQVPGSTSKIPPGMPIAVDTGTIDLGQRECCDHGNFDGWMDGVRIYDRPIDAVEARNLYLGIEP